MTWRAKLWRLGSDSRGVTAVEFAIIAPIMLFMTMGLMEIGYQAYVQSILEGALNKAARDSSLETGANQAANIDARVQSMVRKVARKATFTTTRKSYHSFSDVGKAEAFTDSNNNGAYDVGECFVDANANTQWDAEQGRTGQGGADDIVSYRMTARYPELFPLSGMLGWSKFRDVTAMTTLRNQPFGQQAPKAVCP